MKIRIDQDGIYDMKVDGRYSKTRIYIPDDVRSQISGATVMVDNTNVDINNILKSNGSVLINHGRGATVHVDMSGVSTTFYITVLND